MWWVKLDECKASFKYLCFIGLYLNLNTILFRLFDHLIGWWWLPLSSHFRPSVWCWTCYYTCTSWIICLFASWRNCTHMCDEYYMLFIRYRRAAVHYQWGFHGTDLNEFRLNRCCIYDVIALSTCLSTWLSSWASIAKLHNRLLYSIGW